MIPVSLVVITLNEEAFLARCLASAASIVSEIVVVDSGSTDRTVAIAKEAGARVIHRPFKNFRDQKQFAISQATHDIVLNLDADEWLSPALQAEMKQVIEGDIGSAYALNRLSTYAGKPIRHGAWFPDWIIRLFDRRVCQHGDAETHESLVVPKGVSVVRLKGHVLHEAYQGLTPFLAKQAKYARHIAEERHRKGKRSHPLNLLIKPAFRFFRDYILKQGFRDGYAGYLIARVTAQYVFWREAYLREFTSRGSREE